MRSSVIDICQSATGNTWTVCDPGSRSVTMIKMAETQDGKVAVTLILRPAVALAVLHLSSAACS
jgi:hypothetical protein